ncbi:MAG: hypothetical protein J6W22_09060 [Fibrobacter sp.]|nr:hypothetical protein [Fibrobacter sp.]
MAMRSIIIALFLTLVAFAQEMDTTYIKNEQGQTVGIIHKKGTVPVIPKAAPAYAYSAQQDSIEARYTKKAERSTQSGARFKSVSTRLFIGGGIGLAVTLPTLIYSSYSYREYEEEQKRKNPDYEPPTDGDFLGFLSFVGVGVSIGVLIAGAICKYSSVRRFRDAEHFKKELELYRQQKPSISLEILPMFNPINQAFGGNLLLDF